jgi:hypothetical protein
VNSFVSCIATTTVFCCLFVVLLAVSSLEFPTEIFLVTCARETLINKWDALGTKIIEGVHSLDWEGGEEKSWWKIGIVVGEYQWVVGFLNCEWKMRDQPILWISSPSLGVNYC